MSYLHLYSQCLSSRMTGSFRAWKISYKHLLTSAVKGVWVSVKCVCKFLTRFKQACWFFKVHVMLSGYFCYITSVIRCWCPCYTLRWLCVCVWLVVINVQKKEVILITVRYETAVAWAIWCSGQFFISLACMDASKMLLSQHVCSGIPCKLQEIWSQRSISAWSVECMTLIIPSLSWHCSEAAWEPGQWAHCQIHLVLIPYHLMSQNVFLETFYFTFFHLFQKSSEYSDYT